MRDRVRKGRGGTQPSRAAGARRPHRSPRPQSSRPPATRPRRLLQRAGSWLVPPRWRGFECLVGTDSSGPPRVRATTRSTRHGEARPRDSRENPTDGSWIRAGWTGCRLRVGSGDLGEAGSEPMPSRRRRRVFKLDNRESRTSNLRARAGHVAQSASSGNHGLPRHVRGEFSRVHRKRRRETGGYTRRPRAAGCVDEKVAKWEWRREPTPRRRRTADADSTVKEAERR